MTRGCLGVSRPACRADIAVFTFFSIPAVLMSTDYCVDVSDEPTGPGCNVLCECVLALRSLATVLVFFSDRRCRDELLDYKALLSRCRRRLGKLWACRCCRDGDDADRSLAQRQLVRFVEIEEYG